MSTIWQAIRAHFGFQSTGAHFLDFNDIHLEPDERPEDLYQRLVNFVEDNLLKANDGVRHHGEAITSDEDISPTLENMIVLTWLHDRVDMDVDVLAGTPFMITNDISLRPAKQQVTVQGHEISYYGVSKSSECTSSIRRTHEKFERKI